MGIRSLLHPTPEQPRSYTLPELNREIVRRLESGLGDAMAVRDGIRREINAMERRTPANPRDKEGWAECLRTMREFEKEAERVVQEAENELKDAKTFENALCQSQQETGASLGPSKQLSLDGTKGPAPSPSTTGPAKDPLDRTVDMSDARRALDCRPSMRRDSVVNLIITADARRFMHDPEFQEEFQEIRRAFRPANVNKSAFLIGNLGLDNSAGRGSLLIKRTSFVEQVKVSSGLTEYLTNNSAFKTYPITETRPSRVSLPALRDPAAKANYWRVIKENIGNGLHGLILPVYMREPLTFNQKVAEMMEYQHVLRAANRSPSETARMAGVAAFFLMSLGQGKGRAGLPFSCRLGETFDLVQDDFRLLVETVSVTPQAQALYAECDDFVVTGSFQPTVSITVSAVVIDTKGEYEVQLKSSGDRYLVRVPSVVLTDFVYGDLSFVVKGELKVSRLGSKGGVKVTFKPKGWSDKTDCGFAGEVTSDAGDVVGRLTGRWDDQVTFQGPNGEKPVVLATLTQPTSAAAFQYNFGTLAINLNHLSTSLATHIPPTDSRWRSDVRAYEYGNLEMATLENFRIEDLQGLNSGIPSGPRWYTQTYDSVRFRFGYRGGYFEAREKQRWPADLKLLFD